jgi:hypothetical protein
MRIYSIRTRILGGFASLILLQAGVAVAVWRAENQVDAATAADAAADVGSQRIGAVQPTSGLDRPPIANSSMARSSNSII